MPYEQDVFDAQLALVADASESQCLTAARKSINSVSFAIGWGDTACAMDGNDVAFDRVSSPGIPPVIPIEVDIERTVTPDTPDRSKRVGPRPGDSSWTRALIVRTGVTKRACNRDQQ